MNRTALTIITALILALVVAPLYVYGSPEVSNAIKHISLSTLGLIVAAVIMRRYPPRGVSLALLLALPLAGFAQTNEPPATAEWSFDPADDRPVDWRGTLKTWATYAGGAILGWFAVDQLDVSEKDRQDKVTQEKADAAALAAAKEAEERTLISGPSTPFRYAISGTFAGSNQAALNGATWQPSITFGNQSSTKGGSIAAYALPPSGIGAVSQIVTGLGAWPVVGENEILIEGTGLYDGRARLANVPPPGSIGAGSGMTTNGGLYLSGGTVTAFEVQP